MLEIYLYYYFFFQKKKKNLYYEYSLSYKIIIIKN